MIVRQCASVLKVHVSNRRNCRHAESVDGGSGAGAVPLEIAMERLLALSQRELISGAREVIEADIDITGGGEALLCELPETQPGFGIRQLFPLIEYRLSGLQPRNVSVAEDREAIGLQVQNGFKGSGKRSCCLERQAVDQVDIDRGEASGAEPGDGLFVQRVGLMTMDRELHPAIGVLDAKRSTAGSQAVERFDLRPGKAARIDLHADLGVTIKVEIAVQDFGEAIDLAGGEKRGRAAAEVELHNGAIGIEAEIVERDFTREIIEITIGGVFVSCDDRGAAAVPTT